MDLQKSIRIAVETGKTEMGAKQGKLLALKGKAKLILISSNCPKNMKEEIVYNAEKSNLPHYEASFTSLEIGSICGKPFPVSVLSIIEPGNSDIMKITEKGTVIESEVKEEKETKAAVKNRAKDRKRARKAEGAEAESKESEGSESDEEKDVETQQ